MPTNLPPGLDPYDGDGDEKQDAYYIDRDGNRVIDERDGEKAPAFVMPYGDGVEVELLLKDVRMTPRQQPTIRDVVTRIRREAEARADAKIDEANRTWGKRVKGWKVGAIFSFVLTGLMLAYYAKLMFFGGGGASVVVTPGFPGSEPAGQYDREAASVWIKSIKHRIDDPMSSDDPYAEGRRILGLPEDND